MPLYDRRCRKCGHEWETQEPMLPSSPATCPECGATDTDRLISGRRSFVLRGTGWARDGYTR